jgi:8-oxo-dGTP diphosphatase
MNPPATPTPPHLPQSGAGVTSDPAAIAPPVSIPLATAATGLPSPGIPYRIAVLVYIFNDAGQLLLLHRRKPPNKDLYSPIGGKLEQAIGESPYACALREIHEEVGIQLELADLRLLGLVSERAYPASNTSPQGAVASPGHWLMFCFEVIRPLNFAAHGMDEGRLEWVDVSEVPNLEIPKTDREAIWPLVKEHAHGLRGARAGAFFSIHIDCRDEQQFAVTREHPLT